MLHRTRTKRSLSNLAWRALDLLIGFGGLYCLYLASTGIWNGEVEIFSKRVSGTISWAQDPLLFASMVTAWVGGGIFLLRLATSSWRAR